ncbi:hypothetical protein M5C99_08770 [Acidovorax sp. NCPPB 2350]|nr:hypothetical protein M5C99_08770 [Acidovorax sp. NCPPB 2350]
MKRYLHFFAFFLAAVSLCLCAFCLINIPINKVSTQIALGLVDGYIKREDFDKKELELLDFHRKWILMNDQSYASAHRNLWYTGIYGFGGLALLNGLLGVMMLRSERRRNTRRD